MGYKMRQDEYAAAHGFHVDIQGGDAAAGTDGSWKVCRGGGIRFDETQGVTTGADQFDHFSPGQKEWEDLVLIGPVTKTRKNMLQWYKDTVAGNMDKNRRNVSVIILGKDGKETHRYNYLDCFLTSYRLTELDAGAEVECEEEVHICVGRSDNYLK